MQFASTGALANALIYFTSTGDLFAAPASSTSVNQKWVVADRYGVTYLGIDLEPAKVSGSSTGPLLLLSTPPGTGVTLYYNGIVYADLTTNGANYLYLFGSASTATEPGIQALGVLDNIDVNLYPKGAGVVDFVYSVTALGGGAAPTLGTIGGSGPGTAAQSGWLRLHINGSTYWTPVWQ